MGIEVGSYAPADVVQTVKTIMPDAPSGISFGKKWSERKNKRISN